MGWLYQAVKKEVDSGSQSECTCVCDNKRYTTRRVRHRVREANGYVESNRKIFK